jgi:hypothetical protein
MAWGGIAFGIAAFINRQVYFAGLVSYQNIPRYFAPVVEEILKALILIWLVRRPKFTYFVDGAIYGFAIGIGFAVFENWQYILAEQGTGLGTALGRVLSTNLIHAAATAMVGVSLGLARFRRSLGHWLILGGGLLAAILLHGVFNNLVTRITGGLVLIYSAVLGFAGVAFIAFVIFRGLAEQRAWIEEKLGMADRVTDQEARVVHQLSDVQQLLEPLAEIYGSEKAEQVERFLLVQARIGIKRKTLEKLQDEKMQRAVEKEIGELRVEMEDARQAVGPYVMASVRSIFPQESSPVFNMLEQRIQEKIAARPATGGMNLWATLGQRASDAAQDKEADDSAQQE